MDDLRGLKPPLGFGFPWFWMTVTIILLLLLLWGTSRWWPTPARQPLRVLRRSPFSLKARLDALARKNWIKTQDAPPFYEALQLIVRQHLHETYQLGGDRLTTTELLGLMQERQLGAMVRDRLQEILETCDLVKFARARPDERQMQQSLLLAYSLCSAPDVEKPVVMPGVSPS